MPFEVELRVPAATILKLLAAAFLVWAVLELAPVVLLVVLAILVAVALDPFAALLERRGLSRGAATLVVALGLAAILGALAVFVAPRIATDLDDLARRLPEFERDAHRELAGWPVADRIATELFALPGSDAFRDWLGGIWGVGYAALGIVGSFGLVLVLALYFLYEGKRLYVWLLAYMPRAQRDRMGETVPEVSDVMRAYIQGQVITSALAAIGTGALAWWLGVPAAMPLAAVAAICDVIPFVGILALLVIAAGLSLAVSPQAALVMALGLAAYHLFESYVIVPAVYGRKLRLSTLSVILALLVGGVLGGPLGAALVLPFVAAYPIVERIWLHEHLRPEVIEDHAALEEAAEHGTEADVEEAIEAVKNGESPPPVH